MKKYLIIIIIIILLIIIIIVVIISCYNWYIETQGFSYPCHTMARDKGQRPVHNIVQVVILS